MLDYTPDDVVRRRFNELSPEQIDAIKTAWATTISIINQVNPQDTSEKRLDALYIAQRISDEIVAYIDGTTSSETIYDRKKRLMHARIEYENAQTDLVAACIAQAALDGADPRQTQWENKDFVARMFD